MLHKLGVAPGCQSKGNDFTGDDMVKANPLRIGVLCYLFLESHRLLFGVGEKE